MTDIFDVIDNKLGDVRASVKRKLKQRVQDGAVVASFRHGKLHFEEGTESRLAIKRQSEVRPSDIAIKRTPAISLAEVKVFATTKR